MACVLSELGVLGTTERFSHIEAQRADFLELCANTINGLSIPSLETGSMGFSDGSTQLVPPAAATDVIFDVESPILVHPSFTADVPNGTFTTVTAGRYLVTANVSIGTAAVAGPADYEMRLLFTLPSLGLQGYTLDFQQVVAPIVAPFSQLSLNGSVIVNLPAGVTVSISVRHTSLAGESVYGPVVGAGALPDDRYSYFQISKVQ